MRSFDDLVAEAEAADVSGWDFSWLDGRATEERPGWGYQRLLAERLGTVGAALDIQTGGGEVLAGALDAAAAVPRVLAATESWPPNLAKATAALGARGGVVVADPDEPPLPFADGAFELVTSRHPVRAHWGEITRVLRPGGSYLGQHVGPESAFELIEEFLGPLGAAARRGRHPDDEAAAARAAGLEVVDLRTARLRMEFRDIGAIVWILRKVIWWVPGFTVAEHLGTLRALDARMRHDGPFVAHSSRHLIEARRG
ncbi:class I SAM-dependent methyltransferase [Pseudolysinimonas kribbensis]|uniref:Methyltransferase type 11 n=1 Tax=Pseudolysinimonas kribbensis TaxID=433641 RepID=A0ABQ6K6Q1_9MICO|nr:methyltransferase domain-containing protein [Pseudolysinimonas kribbensis]GMA95285.1 methyltransferase type 11 [Pseudolysinimonas kribbensis]